MTPVENSALRAIILVGFMGAGKTSVGRFLAARLNWRFVDLDDCVEAREGRKIADIFRDSGEPAFRQAEAAALRELLSEVKTQTHVIALGGGAFVQPENQHAIRQTGIPVVFLDAQVDILRNRCTPDPLAPARTRPLFQDENQFRQLYEARRSAYMMADMRVDTTGLNIEQVATAVLQLLATQKATPGRMPNDF